MVLLFIIFHFLVVLGMDFPLLESYLDDLLCLPIVLSVVLYIHRRFRVKSKLYRLPVAHILLAVVVVVMAFEVIYPVLTPRGTADVFDVFAYGGGAVFFDQYINIG